MPTETSPVGPLTLPVVAAGDSTTAFADPTVDALLDFLAWALNNDLNTRLAELTGTSAVAVPDGTNDGDKDFRYNYDPFEERAPHTRMRTPALYIWWDGNSTPWQQVVLQKGTQRDLQLLYLFDELPGSDEFIRRAGLFGAVNDSLAKAAERGSYPTYSYGGKPAGTPIEESAGEFASWEWEYLGGRGIKRIGLDDPNTRSTGTRVAGRARPGFAALLRVRELIFPAQTVDPDDVLTDGEVRLLHDGVEILDRTLEPDDGDNARP